MSPKIEEKISSANKQGFSEFLFSINKVEECLLHGCVIFVLMSSTCGGEEVMNLPN
jgi:hypothetical protein